MSKQIFSQLDSFPEFLTSNHLVDLGLYTSIDAAYSARIHGKSPDFLQFKRKILYPKTSVLQFLEQHIHKQNADPQETESQELASSNSL